MRAQRNLAFRPSPICAAIPRRTAGVGFAETFFAESIDILRRLDPQEIERMAAGLHAVRESGGRLFILGVGGSAGSRRATP